MLIIKPIEDKDEQEKITGLCGIEFRSEMFAYKAHNDGELLACAQFDIREDGAYIDAMRCAVGTKEDFEGMFILGRAVLNFLDLCGVTTAYYYSPVNETEIRLAKAIGFKDKDGVLTANLTGMFDGKCEAHCE